MLLSTMTGFVGVWLRRLVLRRHVAPHDPAWYNWRYRL